jgi:hypothetical protein
MSEAVSPMLARNERIVVYVGLALIILYFLIWGVK